MSGSSTFRPVEIAVVHNLALQDWQDRYEVFDEVVTDPPKVEEEDFVYDRIVPACHLTADMTFHILTHPPEKTPRMLTVRENGGPRTPRVAEWREHIPRGVVDTVWVCSAIYEPEDHAHQDPHYTHHFVVCHDEDTLYVTESYTSTEGYLPPRIRAWSPIPPEAQELFRRRDTFSRRTREWLNQVFRQATQDAYRRADRVAPQWKDDHVFHTIMQRDCSHARGRKRFVKWWQQLGTKKRKR